MRIFGDHEERTVAQLERCVSAEEGAAGVLCADGHVGYSMPIGGVVAYREHVSPSGVGWDIGCGNKAVLTDLALPDVQPDLPRVMDEISTRISFGVGRSDGRAADHPVIDEIGDAAFAPQRALRDLAAKQLGTVGAGNHYVDLFADEQDRVWVGVHFGSRGFGHKTAGMFMDDAGGMDAPPTLLSAGSELGAGYAEAMALAGRYAYAGRDVVCAEVCRILGATAVEEVHNHHNYAWREEHGGEQVWVVRKGATPAFPGQRGFVGATMGEPAVILEGVESDTARDALYSTVHGAGRVMSRTQAAGRRRPKWACTRCDWVQPPHTPKPDACPQCGGAVKKRWVQLSEGAIDFPTVRAELAARGIELRGGAADEAPAAYKRLDEVLAHHEGTVRILHTLRPIGVAMAGADTFDPYKD
jgi:tRNA-splicing ligase RtcB (3'-phosphate/5'-hydroxy nucleic acid ligase)